MISLDFVVPDYTQMWYLGRIHKLQYGQLCHSVILMAAMMMSSWRLPFHSSEGQDLFSPIGWGHQWVHRPSQERVVVKLGTEHLWVTIYVGKPSTIGRLCLILLGPIKWVATHVKAGYGGTWQNTWWECSWPWAGVYAGCRLRTMNWRWVPLP